MAKKKTNNERLKYRGMTSQERGFRYNPDNMTSYRRQQRGQYLSQKTTPQRTQARIANMLTNRYPEQGNYTKRNNTSTIVSRAGENSGAVINKTAGVAKLSNIMKNGGTVNLKRSASAKRNGIDTNTGRAPQPNGGSSGNSPIASRTF